MAALPQIANDLPIKPETFITTQQATQADDAGGVVKLDFNGQQPTVFTQFKFGGNGSDGALTISSGTTTIDLAGAEVLIKNYTSISITGTGALAFSNPHANGTIIIFRCVGDVTITTSATRAIDLRSLGGTGGNGGAASAGNGNDGSVANGIVGFDSSNGTKGLGGSFAATGNSGAIYTVRGMYTLTTTRASRGKMYIAPGSGGGGGGGGTGASGGTGGNGGRGAGAMYIECRGALNITGTVDISGATGSNAGTATSTHAGGGGGGGGAGGMFVILYGSLTANSATVTVTGGAGGNGSNAGGAGSSSPGGAGGGGGGAYGGAGGAGGPGGNGGDGSNGVAGSNSVSTGAGGGTAGTKGTSSGSSAGGGGGGGGTAGEYFIGANPGILTSY